MSFRQGFLSILFFSILFVFSLVTASSKLVWAASEENTASCQPIYGGGETCVQTGNITINKTIQNPQTLQYVDNLGTDDSKYAPGQLVHFKIIVKNKSNASIKNIVVKDRLPQYVDCAYGGTGQCDSATKIINLIIDNLNANETKTFTIVGIIASKSQLPENKETICLINQGVAVQMQQISQDNSQFCIQKNSAPSSNTQPVTPGTTKGGLPVYPPSGAKTTPQTGPETIALFGLFASGLIGYILRGHTTHQLDKI